MKSWPITQAMLRFEANFFTEPTDVSGYLGIAPS